MEGSESPKKEKCSGVACNNCTIAVIIKAFLCAVVAKKSYYVAWEVQQHRNAVPVLISLLIRGGGGCHFAFSFLLYGARNSSCSSRIAKAAPKVL